MAERQLQVTQLNSSARAMDTYVRPELEKNARAIGLLLNSIDKTDNDRAIKNAEIEAVTEALSEGPKDLHNRVGFSSTRPDYIATRLENRGQQFARESLPKLESDFQEFLLGSNDNGTDIEPYLKEQFGSLMSSMEGGGGSQFLIAGASDILVAAKADMQKRHMEYIDKRAMDETMTHLSMRVDGIVHQKITNDEMGQPLPPQAFNDRIKAMDSLAVDMSQTTPLTKGQANKAVFESLLAMAAGNDPENAERYIHMAKLVRYAKGKNGELRPEAFEAIAMAEDAAARKINSKNIAEAAALKAQKEKDKVEALDHLRNFRKAIKQTLLGFNEGVDPSRKQNEGKRSKTYGKLAEGRRKKATGGKVVTENDYETGGYVESMGPKLDKGVNFLIEAWEEWKMGPMTEPGMIEHAKKDLLSYLETQFIVENLEEEKGKDHDGDGDVDADDYMAGKDKAIKKALNKDEQLVKENLKSIIAKVLEEGTINEAATNKLADWGSSYETFPGVKPVVNSLENIVTEIEQFYDKIGDKIADTFSKTADFKNEEGLNIGAFIAPSLESAFKQDLRPVLKGGFIKKVELPKVKTISRAEIDRPNMGTPDIAEEEAKQTVYSAPFNGTLRETKKKR